MEDYTTEEWRAIPGYEGLYEVSDQGNVRRIVENSARLLRPSVSNSGYQTVSLSKRGRQRSYFVHQLVTLAFIGPEPLPDIQVHHINSNREDNRAVNLEYLTRAENMYHTIGPRGFKPQNNRTRPYKFTEDMIRDMRETFKIEGHKAIPSLAVKYDTSASHVYGIIRRKQYRWVTD